MKFLVVDDEPGIGSLFGRTLRRFGHDAVVATHPVRAMELLDDSIDAVISDIDMPDMNGVELARTILARYHDMPIAFCTGSDPEEDIVQEAARIGDVLPKVWTVDEVLAAVADLQRQHQRRRGRCVVRRHGTQPGKEREATRKLEPAADMRLDLWLSALSGLGTQIPRL